VERGEQLPKRQLILDLVRGPTCDQVVGVF
jgi:hypothetical protein